MRQAKLGQQREKEQRGGNPLTPPPGPLSEDTPEAESAQRKKLNAGHTPPESAPEEVLMSHIY